VRFGYSTTNGIDVPSIEISLASKRNARRTSSSLRDQAMAAR
jgi:hypothetical protein